MECCNKKPASAFCCMSVTTASTQACLAALACVSCIRMSMADFPVHTTWPETCTSLVRSKRRLRWMASTDAVTSSGSCVSVRSSSLLAHSCRFSSAAFRFAWCQMDTVWSKVWLTSAGKRYCLPKNQGLPAASQHALDPMGFDTVGFKHTEKCKVSEGRADSRLPALEGNGH